MTDRPRWPDPAPDPPTEPTHEMVARPDDDDDRPGFFERLKQRWENRR